MVGSSPLARGLLDALLRKGYLYGIIPARAGFTRYGPPSGRTRQDHPRSRGVYCPSGASHPNPPGSSPLARGLLQVKTQAHPQARIIPARAGFTGEGVRPSYFPRDHPRSRGVYPPRRPSRHSGMGSSPLARGLLLPPHGMGREEWIIPARAGFTSFRYARVEGEQDHPRSRGVYKNTDVTGKVPVGSSPLARGLPLYPYVMATRDRIIPARAGFTWGLLPCCRSTRDHPRSRGVYSNSTSASGWGFGSSPLARGLPPGWEAGVGEVRIIPARAGFTQARPPLLGGRADHPRSRGVYIFSQSSSVEVLGSSPLARGLPVDDVLDGLPGRIIPARAGFTECCSTR